MFDRILLIDDDHPTNILHKIMIEKSGLSKNVIEFTYAEEALEWLKDIIASEFPSLVLLDINMPRMTGFDFVLEFKNFFPCELSRRIVILTTSMNPDDALKAREMGIFEYLTKPLTVEKLEHLHSRMLEKVKTKYQNDRKIQT